MPNLHDISNIEMDETGVLTDDKVKALVSDIHDSLLKWVEESDAKKIADALNFYGAETFIDWYITEVYMPTLSDIKIMIFINENIGDIVSIIITALNSLKVSDTVEIEKVDQRVELLKKANNFINKLTGKPEVEEEEA